MKLTSPCIVLPSAPGVSPLDGSAVVAICPLAGLTSAAGSTVTASLTSGMFCRYDSSAPTDIPRTSFDSVRP